MASSTNRDKSYDIFNLTDDALAQKLYFVQECGYGNWGSVWLCMARSKSSADGTGEKLAVKLVHRRSKEKPKTTAARVKSLWNEMKIVSSFKSNPHPAIIPFYSFIVTPSYAMITMPYHPKLIPVEVDELHARGWFRLLLSGVEFLHKNGVVHNDIKPANILLSYKNVPVLVDFGFAERYDTGSGTAFHSNLSYGTPEYLSPERARGLPHDTRKSDVWSLGITFFEILVGRTPFEESDQVEFTSKEDLERYWSRTLRGKWVGSWKISRGAERLLRRMIAPNADLRCTASEAMSDSFWSDPESAHRRSASFASSIVFEKDLSKLMEASPPWEYPSPNKENLSIPPGLGSPTSPDKHKHHPITRAKSQPRVTSAGHRSKRIPPPSVSNLPTLPTILASPPTSPTVPQRPAQPIIAASKANDTTTSRARKPFGQVAPTNNQTLGSKPSLEKRKSRVLADLSGVSTASKKGKNKENSAIQRVKEWEREKQRLREIQRLEELERERDEELHDTEVLDESLVALANGAKEALDALASPPPEQPSIPEVRVTPTVHSSIGSFKHAIRKSIDRTVRRYASAAGSAGALSVEANDDAQSRRSHSERESWEDDALVREAKSSLPVVRHAIHNERMAADNQLNRMKIWMSNVEKVVEDARQTFAASSTRQAPLPPLPLAPLSRSGSQSRSNRSSRVPRKILAANKIFVDNNEQLQSPTSDYTMSSFVTSMYGSPTPSDATAPFSEAGRSPGQRRATVSIGPSDDIETGSPSKKKQKSQSHGNLLQMRIKSAAELEEMANSPPPPRRTLFVPPAAVPPRAGEDVDTSVRISKSFDELTASPHIVEPYPSRPTSTAVPIPDTPNRIKLDAVYDRFLMATSGVKRLGKGYESDNQGPVYNTVTSANVPNQKNNHNPRAFNSMRRPMPPPVASDDQRHSLSVDELGVMHSTPVPGSSAFKDDGNTTVTIMRRAIKALVPGKTVSRRLSRIAA